MSIDLNKKLTASVMYHALGEQTRYYSHRDESLMSGWYYHRFKFVPQKLEEVDRYYRLSERDLRDETMRPTRSYQHISSVIASLGIDPSKPVSEIRKELLEKYCLTVEKPTSADKALLASVRNGSELTADKKIAMIRHFMHEPLMTSNHPSFQGMPVLPHAEDHYSGAWLVPNSGQVDKDPKIFTEYFERREVQILEKNRKHIQSTFAKVITVALLVLGIAALAVTAVYFPVLPVALAVILPLAGVASVWAGLGMITEGFHFYSVRNEAEDALRANKEIFQ